jgi:hypothetical protein
MAARRGLGEDTKQATIVAEQEGRRRTFGHVDLSPDGQQTYRRSGLFRNGPDRE